MGRMVGVEGGREKAEEGNGQVRRGRDLAEGERLRRELERWREGVEVEIENEESCVCVYIQYILRYLAEIFSLLWLYRTTADSSLINIYSISYNTLHTVFTSQRTEDLLFCPCACSIPVCLNLSYL